MSGGRVTSRGRRGQAEAADAAETVTAADPGGPGDRAADPGAPAGRAALATWWADRHPALRQVIILLGCTALGIVVTWPRVRYLTGRLPNSRDEASYVWDMWWMARQVGHLSNPFTTHQIIAPVGAPLAYHALMPLAGVLMIPVTLTAGPAFSVNLLSVLLPGLLCYAMYRAARLWLPGTGAFASGVFFGLSSMLTWRVWFHLNIAAGLLFLPITLEVAVRLRRQPGAWRAVALGLVIGLSLLVDSESFILALIVAAAALAPWLLTLPVAAKLRLLILGGAVTAVAASPQIVAMLQQRSALQSSPRILAHNFVSYGVGLPQMFAPSPRVAAFGLTGLGRIFYRGIATEGMPTFGVTLTALALLGAILAWRQRTTRIWLLLWGGACLLALGPVLYLGRHAYAPLALNDHGYHLSALMPYTWFVHLPGLSGFREANRFTPVGLIPAALLAGTAIARIRARYAPALLLVVALAALELGWSAPHGWVPPAPASSKAAAAAATMPARLPAVGRGIAADHSGSLVVDVPLGFRSGTLAVGPGFPAEELVQATVDGHPRAIGYVARLPLRTAMALLRHRFYADLLEIQRNQPVPATFRPDIQAAAADARQMNVGWVLVWKPVTAGLGKFLTQTGFHFAYRADGVSVYRAAR